MTKQDPANTTDDTETPGANEFPKSLPSHWWTFRRLEKLRLAAEIMEEKQRGADLEQRLQGADDGSPDRQSLERLVATHQRLLCWAQAFYAKGHEDSAWRLLWRLDREMVSSLDATEVDTRVVSTAREAAKKLSGWRSEAVEDLGKRYKKLRRQPPGADDSDDSDDSDDGDDKGPGPALHEARVILREMLFHMQSEHGNVYHKQGLLRRQVHAVSAALAVLLVAILVLSFVDFFAPLTATVEPEIQQMLWLAILSGLIGGLLSVAYTVMRSDRRKKIPEIGNVWLSTIARPIVGGMLALPIMFFLEAGLLNVGGDDNRWLLLGLCLLGGFSERWFLGLMKSVGEGLGDKGEAGK